MISELCYSQGGKDDSTVTHRHCKIERMARTKRRDCGESGKMRQLEV